MRYAARGGGRDLPRTVRLAALVELYRLDKLTHHQLSQALDLSRLEADGVLKKHNVTEDLLTVDELELQVKDLRRLTNP